MCHRRAAATIVATVAVATLLALAAVPSGVAAPRGTRVARAVAIAKRVWHTRCAGPVVVRFGVRPATRLGPTLATARWRHSHVPGAPFTHCEIILDRRALGARRHVPFAIFCSVFLHEYGHLAGHRHSRRPASIMYPLIRVDPRCTRGRSGS